MVTANNVPVAPIQRISTGIDVLDWIWGSSDFVGLREWGLPVGKITLLPGEGGLGKTRICVALVKALLHKNPKAIVLYFQNESLPSDIVALFDEKDASVSSRLHIEDDTSASDQLKKIDSLRPTLVIVDSITMIDEFGDGKNDRVVKDLVKQYRDIANRTNAHIIFISHVTKAGLAKGSTALPHLVDSVFYAHRVKGQEGFVIETGKHRFGRSNLISIWKYRGPLPTGFPSQEMFDDKEWTRDHSMAKYPRPEKVLNVEEYLKSAEYSEFLGKVMRWEDPGQGSWLKRKMMKFIYG